MSFTGTGLNPGGTVDAVLHSAMMNLGTFTIAANGTVTGRVTIPSSTPVGTHTFVLSFPAGELQTTLTVTTVATTQTESTPITSSTSLAQTGLVNGWMIPVSLLTVSAGAILVTARRRRIARLSRFL